MALLMQLGHIPCSPHLEPNSMSPYREDSFAHATDWKASAAECANARRSALSATITMDGTVVHMLLGNLCSWHDR